MALLVWGPACYALKDRDLWISWSATQRLERLKLIVQNRRFLVLAPRASRPIWPPSHGRGAAGVARAVAEQLWLPAAAGRKLHRSGSLCGHLLQGQQLGTGGLSAGYSRHRADFYIANDRPKRLWLRPLVPEARQQLRARASARRLSRRTGRPPLRERCRSAPSRWVRSLDVFRQAPDPRDSNTRYRIGPVLTLIAMALLAGRREIAEIARFATHPHPAPAASLGPAAQERHPRLLRSSRLRRLLSGAHPHGSGSLCQPAQ